MNNTINNRKNKQLNKKNTIKFNFKSKLIFEI